jgi:site-specific recombinase XerD
MNSNLLFTLIERFFSDYLCSQRNASQHTISAYGDTFRLLLIFLAERQRTTIDRLALQAICPESILAFLDHIERKRSNTIRTRNARLAAIRSFTRFCLPHASATHTASLQRILAIPLKRTVKPVLGYMSREEVAAILAAIDISTAMHLLQAGVPLEVIALWIGHEQPVTTLSYVQADLNMKRECMQLLEHPNPKRRPPHPARFSRLLSFLEAL